ncbi:hypothetical protein CDAR_114931 [Caerostris darwini]|uniref:Uncharacterized protein n=1 Tax=Caerostris darwini TaxID=1538125 RepID=A0AAV4NQA8_9ARAC|nr:hypothetical protein CDAR_114931 [Caerostris darwini]
MHAIALPPFFRSKAKPLPALSHSLEGSSAQQPVWQAPYPSKHRFPPCTFDPSGLERKNVSGKLPQAETLMEREKPAPPFLSVSRLLGIRRLQLTNDFHSNIFPVGERERI